MFAALGLELFLPAFVDCGFLGGGAAAAYNRRNYDAKDLGTGDDRIMNDSYFGHILCTYEASLILSISARTSRI
mgnify:CR=1 FL=1